MFIIHRSSLSALSHRPPLLAPENYQLVLPDLDLPAKQQLAAFAQHVWGSPTLLHGSAICSFSLLHSIPLSGETAIYSSGHPFGDNWVLCSFWPTTWLHFPRAASLLKSCAHFSHSGHTCACVPTCQLLCAIKHLDFCQPPLNPLPLICSMPTPPASSSLYWVETDLSIWDNETEQDHMALVPAPTMASACLLPLVKLEPKNKFHQRSEKCGNKGKQSKKTK